MKHQWTIRIAGLVGLVAAGVVFARWEPDNSRPGREGIPGEDGPALDPVTRDEGRATWMFRRERWDDAIALTNDVIRRDPERTSAWWILAQSHERRGATGDEDAAFKAWTRLNEIASKRSVEYRFPEQFRRLAFVRQRIGDDEGVREAFAKGAYLQRWYITGREPDRIDERWWYNLACLESMAGNADGAFEALERAIERGFTNVEYALGDEDLAPIRDDPRFAQAIDAMRDRAPVEQPESPES